ncbi:uncharacterized protein K452DRAFT_289057 [Aplosporella prunicola CBS 121167]|uniref:ABM domain-containing protein n=1 Tax=Aplosporella prunicola CBS 121167 TaxID=1176127 RepID=A0A6A6BAN4_9PEZI|nr:uncharacterized protein K452DRAFT_289057 [Aplosporella prunicola CBS 121167]KAF2140304.1 hypothetical protein K452DRAFT_289057 [Aplosporella prunicola CBS 121167]
MPVTELALLRLQAGTTRADAGLTGNLRKAKQTMEAFTGHAFHFYTQLEDPALVYIIGAWDSPEQHLHHFIPTPANQHLLTLLRDQLTVDCMFHVALEPCDIPLDAPVLAIARHFVARDMRPHFADTFAQAKRPLVDFTRPKNVVGGWRVEKEADSKEEWVLFTGWDDVDQHSKFAESDGFKEYSKIRGFITGAEIKHAVRWDL